MGSVKRARLEAEALPAVCDEYTGWRPSRGDTVERVSAADLTPRAFFERYVSQRRPVVLTGGLGDAGWRVGAWSDDYLRSRCGDALVRVEARPSASAAFGAHEHQSMRFAAFLNRVAGGDERLYLTTEATRFDAHGRLSVVSSPLTQLLEDLPLRPSLAGRLVPAALNLWLGRSASGASSGLHHDWHDNLYALLRGRKRFELYAPCETPRLYPAGRLERIHANGRINYAGAPSRADGADARDLARVASLDVRRAEQTLAEAEEAAESGVVGARKRVRAAEAELEGALAAALRAGGDAADGFDFQEEAEDWCGRDDYENSDGGGSRGSDDDAAGDAPPPHFSRVDRACPSDFPLFTSAVCTRVDVCAGDMLFLPCGWWHEVTSWSEEGGAAATGTHLALNWWFAPPDTAHADAPYSSDLWERDYAHWARDILPTLSAELSAEQRTT